MIFAGIAIGVCVVAFIWGKLTDIDDIVPFMLLVFGAITLVIVVLALIINPLGVRGTIAEFEAVRASVNAARLNGNILETATLQLKVIQMNEWLAGVQYWNGLAWFDDFIPDEVNVLEPIR